MDMVKELGMAEGGEVPRADNPALAMAIVENPKRMDIFRFCGIRACCWDDGQPSRRARATGKEWIPWFAEANQERFPYLFPSDPEMAHCPELECAEGHCGGAEEKQKQENFALSLAMKILPLEL